MSASRRTLLFSREVLGQIWRERRYFLRKLAAVRWFGSQRRITRVESRAAEFLDGFELIVFVLDWA